MNSTLRLDSFVRQVNVHGPDLRWKPAWLPHLEVLRHRLAEDDASDESREVFQDWRRKVRAAIPPAAEFNASLSPATAVDPPAFLIAET